MPSKEVCLRDKREKMKNRNVTSTSNPFMKYPKFPRVFHGKRREESSICPIESANEAINVRSASGLLGLSRSRFRSMTNEDVPGRGTGVSRDDPGPRLADWRGPAGWVRER